MAQSNMSGPLQVTDALIVAGTASFGGLITASGGISSPGVTASGGTVTAGSNHVSFGTTTPLAGTKGDIVFNTGAVAGGGTTGWICTTAGATATWKAFGSIAS